VDIQARLAAIETRYETLGRELSDPQIVTDQERYRDTARAYAELERIVHKSREYQEVLRQIAGSEALLADPEMKAMAREEIDALAGRRDRLLDELRGLLVPKDPNDERNAIVEIRAGTGGEEASLFASELFRMYSRYAERRGWQVEAMSLSSSGLGGVKEVIALISGREVYGRLRYESGVHRVQRVPQTEASGRIHTSTSTVAILPEADDVQIEIEEKDLRVDTFCASGPGGQGVNTTYSAIRITHNPTGLVVQCQDERSQHKNKARAMKVLRSRLYDLEIQKQQESIMKDRRSQVGTGERSEKIRTYNFPQNRITDHRAGLTLHRLPEVLDGELDPLLDPIAAHFQAERLKDEALT
jgi:peptide chain release factor 1